MKIWLLAAGAAWLVLASASATETARPACVDRETLAQHVAQRTPAARLMLLRNEDAAAFMTALNDLPPPSRFTAEEIMIVDFAPERPTLRIVLFDGGCLTRFGDLPRGTVRTLLNAIAGSGA